MFPLSLRSLFIIAWLIATPTWLAHAQTPSAPWSPVAGGMMTAWGQQLSSEKVWTEYPRPQLARPDWTNLNGLWSYAVTSNQAAISIPQQWLGSILVPFCPESTLSGIGRSIEPQETLWYRRSLPPPVLGRRSILHFEAVDYDTTVYVNGTEVGRHVGGHTPFSFDITDRLQAGQNELVVRVHDATEGYQLHGKQNLIAKGIWYTRVTGIWQTVWMEHLPEHHLTDVDYACEPASGRLTIVPKLAGEAPAKVRATVSFRGTPVGKAEGSGSLSLLIADPQLWSPATPHLYEVQLEVLDEAGKIVDSVQSYTAFREFGKAKDAAGHWRLTLNGQPLFQWGPLDQGWWPDGLLTPPSDQAMLDDIEFLKAAGFNMIRKHIKVEPRRYYYTAIGSECSFGKTR
jgi:beta-galactosidase/beta-glucuronidase